MDFKFLMILILGFGFMFVFTAFQTMCNIEVSHSSIRSQFIRLSLSLCVPTLVCMRGRCC